MKPKVIVAFIVIAIVIGVFVYYDYITRPGPAEQAGAVLDEAIDKTKRIIDVVTE